MTRCFFDGQGACDGMLVRAHLIPRQLLRREFRYGVVLDPWFGWRPLGRSEDRYELEHRTLEQLIGDERSWVPCCGGPVGNGGHHGRVDQSRTLRIPRSMIPAATEEFAAELGLAWWLDREYGQAENAA